MRLARATYFNSAMSSRAYRRAKSELLGMVHGVNG